MSNFDYSTLLINTDIYQQMPTRLILHGDGNDKIELFYDRENQTWDVTITGDYTSSVLSFKKWVLDIYLPASVRKIRSQND